jgi:MFS family permease
MKDTASKTAVCRLAVARLISITGGAAAYAALMFTIYQRTHSPAWLSATLFLIYGVSGFASPLGGWISDHFDRRKVMIVSDLLGVGAFGAMAFAHDPALLLVFAFVSAGRLMNEDKEPKALFLGMALIALSTGGIAVSPWFAPILALSFVAGFGHAVTLVAEKGIQQRRTPDAVRSRVMSAADAIVTVSYAVSLAVSGLVLRAVGPQAVYAIGGLTAAVGEA